MFCFVCTFIMQTVLSEYVHEIKNHMCITTACSTYLALINDIKAFLINYI